jgi:Protein of unknown function (DUF1638)
MAEDGAGERALIVACGALRDEALAVAGDIPVEFCEARLHDHPERLRSSVEEAVSRHPRCKTVLLMYGRCSNGLVGLAAGGRTLILPAVEDCISLLLGSRQRYEEEFFSHPGTYYYTRGWAEEIDDPYQVYLKLVPKYGAETAAELSRMELANYTRVALIDTGVVSVQEYEPYVCEVAHFYRLCMERLQGSLRLLEKLVNGPHDDEFIIVRPGEVLTEDRFWNPR